MTTQVSLKRLASCVMVAALLAGAGTWALGDTAPTPAQTAAIAQVDKAKELLRQNKLAEAKAANDEALRLDPTLQGARVLDQVIGQRLAEAGGTTTQGSGAAKVENANVLSPEQMSRIRLMEMQDKDKVQVTVDRKSLEEYWREVYLKDPQTEGNRAQKDKDLFFAQGYSVKAALMIRESRNQKYIDKVKVLTDPPALLVFRDKIHPYVLNNCANTAGCHGQENPKSGFRLVNKNAGNIATVYTNFFIMTQTKVGDGKMIDRDKAEESLFLQYGLPKDQAKFAHPGKVALGVQFPDSAAKRYQDMAAWVGTLQRIQPEYGVTFAPATTMGSVK